MHRSLGVHISKVRSLQLDQMAPEVLELAAGVTHRTRVKEARFTK